MRIAVLIAGQSRGLQPVKNEALLQALRVHFPDLEVWDIEPSARARAFNLALTFKAIKQSWRGRFNAHPATFDARTRAAGRLIAQKGAGVDALLQIGATFDASHVSGGRPVVIFTDYASVLTRRMGRSWRFDLTEGQAQRRIRQERLALSGAARICTRSQLVADAIARDHAIAPEKLEVVGAGPNILPLGPKATPPRILFIGAEFHRKGGDLLLSAFDRLRQTMPEAVLDAVVPQAHRTEAPGITWHHAVDSAGLSRLLGAASIIAQPSRFETWGDTLIEAMTGGAVPVITDLPPMTEIVRHEQEGLVFPPEDVGALAAALGRLLQDPDLRARLGQAAQARALQNFTQAIVADRLAKALAAAVRA